MPTRKIVLGTILYPSGHHVAAWRHPSTQVATNISVSHYIAAARAAEAAGFEIAFISDRLGVPKGRAEALRRVDEWSHGFEALTLASAVATATETIGIVATASTTFNEPYNLARQLASLDLISNGRIGWNIVTSSLQQESDNFNVGPDFDHAARYDRAGEFVEAVQRLWQSWNPDGFVRDKQSGVFFEPDAVESVNHSGTYFRSKGPLNVIPSRQGRPLLVQAGSSDAGKTLAARTADVVFTAHSDIVSARGFYQDVKKRAVASGRHVDDVLVLPGIFPVIGKTKTEAEEKYAALQDLIQPDVALSLLETYLGDVDLSGVDIDGPLPDLPVSNSIRSRQTLLTELARKEGLSVGALARRIAGARGHWQVIGTAEAIAGEIEDWVAGGAADGFMLLPPTFPAGQDDFIAGVVPLLRERGLLTPGPTDGSLRERLGLPHLARSEAGNTRNHA
ncbi:LLM class flavin-dependent oxidoreductase [Sinorhizobium sp. RAC02]|uniref:LLM class flavin-dependent oxidoreductase n=1 Tax=Sinorhizobium sp. RAC02 TaxID=1842534 RepID=UPI00083DC7C0|nr:LLM class flavin-dependent oxidoreductase [Sinorhizobium sp. RAC02]AOF93754.1 FMN-dependent oxidoreductase, nitrilotriacetate monooxygenase family protein [Sinorhizobium sp. RAC02]